MTRTGPNAGVTNYVWDNESRLVSINGQTTASYTYNGADARVTANDGQARTFRRDGVGVTAPVLSDGQATYTPGVSERRAGTSRYLHSGLKNAESRTVASNAIESVRTYDAFGNVLSTAGGSWTGALGYAGGFGYQEDPSGLKLLGHRYYDSETGRFISRDPAEDGRNWYTYCDNNPLRRTDPTGLAWHNNGQVLVSPEFEGTVEVIGEIGPDNLFYSHVIGKGEASHPDMDVDYVIITTKDGKKKAYFLPGNGELYNAAGNRDTGDLYTIDKFGYVAHFGPQDMKTMEPRTRFKVLGVEVFFNPVPVDPDAIGFIKEGRKRGSSSRKPIKRQLPGLRTPPKFIGGNRRSKLAWRGLQ